MAPPVAKIIDGVMYWFNIDVDNGTESEKVFPKAKTTGFGLKKIKTMASIEDFIIVFLFII